MCSSFLRSLAINFSSATSISIFKPSTGLAADGWHSLFVFTTEFTVAEAIDEDWIFAKQIGAEIVRVPALRILTCGAVNAI